MSDQKINMDIRKNDFLEVCFQDLRELKRLQYQLKLKMLYRLAVLYLEVKEAGGLGPKRGVRLRFRDPRSGLSFELDLKPTVVCNENFRKELNYLGILPPDLGDVISIITLFEAMQRLGRARSKGLTRLLLENHKNARLRFYRNKKRENMNLTRL